MGTRELQLENDCKPPSLLRGFIAGLIVAVAGSFIWGVFESMTGMVLHLAPMLSMGYVVGVFVGNAGRGCNYRFGLLGAALGSLGCFLGNLFSMAGVWVAQTGDMPCKPFHPVGLWLIFCDQARWLDAIIYLAAALEAFYFASRRSDFHLPRRTPGVPPTWRQRIAGFAILASFASFFGVVFLSMHRRTIPDMALTRDGRTLAVSISGLETGMENAIVFWDPVTGKTNKITPGKVGRTGMVTGRALPGHRR